MRGIGWTRVEEADRWAVPAAAWDVLRRPRLHPSSLSARQAVGPQQHPSTRPDSLRCAVQERGWS